jgi:hypothetical protein
VAFLTNVTATEYASLLQFEGQFAPFITFVTGSPILNFVLFSAKKNFIDLLLFFNLL